MRNIALTFLGCFTILAACSNSDDAEKPVVPVPTGDVAIYTTTSSLTRDLTRDAVNFSPNSTRRWMVSEQLSQVLPVTTCY